MDCPSCQRHQVYNGVCRLNRRRYCGEDASHFAIRMGVVSLIPLSPDGHAAHNQWPFVYNPANIESCRQYEKEVTK